MKVLFAFNSYGLGHATRTLPIVKEVLRRKHKVFITTSGRSLDFLKKELGKKAMYFELRDYSFSKVFSEKKFSAKKFFLLSRLFIKEIKIEHQELLKLHAQHKFDVVFADARMGMWIPGIPCYLMTNQIKVGDGGLLNNFAQWYSEKFNRNVRKNFTKVVVPDTKAKSISGELTHNLKKFKPQDIEYIGILSMLEKKKVNQDIDIFISISGPEPQRTVFENKVMEQLDTLQGKNVVITLGVPEKINYHKKIGTITIYGMLNRQKQAQTMNRAKLVVTRSGYSTVMDLAELGKKALYIPTSGQPEQEYLAKYHMEQKNNLMVRIENLNLAADCKKALTYKGYKPLHRTNESVRRCLKLILSDK
jgi:uncharacterized protein (TIGR00661 family)